MSTAKRCLNREEGGDERAGAQQREKGRRPPHLFAVQPCDFAIRSCCPAMETNLSLRPRSGHGSLPLRRLFVLACLPCQVPSARPQRLGRQKGLHSWTMSSCLGRRARQRYLPYARQDSSLTWRAKPSPLIRLCADMSSVLSRAAFACLEIIF